MNTVYRFRIYPNKSHRELFTKTFGCVRFVYNTDAWGEKSLL